LSYITIAKYILRTADDTSFLHYLKAVVLLPILHHRFIIYWQFSTVWTLCRTTTVGVSGGYGITSTSDGVVYMWKLSTGSKLDTLHHFQGMLQCSLYALVTLHWPLMQKH